MPGTGNPFAETAGTNNLGDRLYGLPDAVYATGVQEIYRLVFLVRQVIVEKRPLVVTPAGGGPAVTVLVDALKELPGFGLGNDFFVTVESALGQDSFKDRQRFRDIGRGRRQPYNYCQSGYGASDLE